MSTERRPRLLVFPMGEASKMRSVCGFVTAVQEGRFRLVTDDGCTLPVVLSHRCSAEPQDLPRLQNTGARVRIDYTTDPHLIAVVAHRIEFEEPKA